MVQPQPIRPIKNVPVSLEIIRAALARSPPGQGVMDMEVEDIYAFPFYLEWLLARLEQITPNPNSLASMSNLIFNLRIVYWHLQISKAWRPSIKFNSFHWQKRRPHPLIELYR